MTVTVSITPAACAHGAPPRARGAGPKLHEARRASPGTGGGEVLIARTHHDRGARVSLERLVLAGAPLLLQLLSGQLVLRQVAIRALEHTNAATARTERRHSGQRQGHRRASPRTKHTACRPRSRDSRSTKACDPRRRLRAPGAFVSRALRGEYQIASIENIGFRSPRNSPFRDAAHKWGTGRFRI